MPRYGHLRTFNDLVRHTRIIRIDFEAIILQFTVEEARDVFTGFVLAKLSLPNGQHSQFHSLWDNSLLMKDIELIVSEQGSNIVARGFQMFGDLRAVIETAACYLKGHRDGAITFFLRRSIFCIEVACPSSV